MKGGAPSGPGSLERFSWTLSLPSGSQSAPSPVEGGWETSFLENQAGRRRLLLSPGRICPEEGLLLRPHLAGSSSPSLPLCLFLVQLGILCQVLCFVLFFTLSQF